MQLLICFSVLVMATLSQAFMMPKWDDPKVKAIADQCAAENKVDISSFAQGKPLDRSLFEKHEYRCFSKCMMEKMGFISDTGEAKIEVLKETMKLPDDHPVFEHIKTCYTTVTETDICDKVFAVKKCVMEKMRPAK